MHVRHVGVVAVLVVAAAACGSSSSKSSSTKGTSANPYGNSTAASTTTAPSATGAKPVSVQKVKGDTLFATAKGFTVYAFAGDTPTASACNAGCDTVWPPVTVTGTPPSTIDGAKITVLTRSDGTKQIEVNGHPVYIFSGDTKPGETNGQGVAGKWYYVNEKGEPDKG